MNESESTFQRMDPLGGMGARVTSVVAAVAACVYAVVADVITRKEIGLPYLAMLAIGAVTAAAAVVIVASSPYRAPFTRRSNAIAISLTFAGAVLAAGSEWNTNTHIRDDWGPLALGLMLFAAAPYRPARELVEFSILSAVGVGLLTLLQVGSFVAKLPAIVFVVVAVTPVLLLSAFAAAFAAGTVRNLEQMRGQARQEARSRRVELNAVVAQSVQRNRLVALNRDVLPFLSDVLSREEILPSDRQRARLIADSLRSLMVAEVDRSWLDSAVESETAGEIPEAVEGRVRDDDRLADLMRTDQRTALRALLVFLRGCPAVHQGSLRIVITGDDLVCRTAIVAVLTSRKRAVQKTLTPYFAVLRSVFNDLRVQSAGSTVTVRFSYDRH